MINNYVSWFFSCLLILAGADLIGGQKNMKPKDYYEGPTPYVYEMHKLYDAVSNYVKKEMHLRLFGAGGEMMNGIHGMELNFQSDRYLKDDEVIVIFRKILGFAIDFANHNEIIREACDDKEMKSTMVRFFLINGKTSNPAEIETVSLGKNKVTFWIKKENQIRSEVVKEIPLEK